MREPAPARRLPDVVVFAAFLAVPLLVSRVLWDQYVSVKWYALEALAACWLLAEAWAGGGAWPRFVRENAALFAMVLLLGLVSVLRSGPELAVAPLVERTAVLALAVCAYRWVRRREGSLEPARAATALALFAVTAIGLAQALGHDPLAALSASDRRGSTFGNANMAAQYVALAVLLLLASPRPRRRWRARAEAALMAVASAWLLLLGTRSVILAMGAGILALTLSSSRAAAARKVLAATAAAGVVALAWFAAARLLDEDMRSRKVASTEYRLRVWSETLRLTAEHPLGVGAGNFEDAHRRYQADGPSFLDERQVFRHPHNEYLRVAVEEGLPLFVLLTVLLVRLALRLARAREGTGVPGVPLVAAWSAFLAVEAFFQFPLALAFPALATALLLGLALWRAEPPEATAVPARWTAAWRVGAGATAVLLLAGASRVARSEWLFVNAAGDVGAQDRACRLDPRNLSACVMAAYLHGASGDLAGGRSRTVRVLERAPHYPPAIKLLAQLAIIAGDREAGCTYLTAYDVLFRGQSTLHGELLGRCDERERRAAAERVPSPRYERFPLAGEDAR